MYTQSAYLIDIYVYGTNMNQTIIYNKLTFEAVDCISWVFFHETERHIKF